MSVSKILKRRELHSAHSHAIVVATLTEGDPRVSITWRYWCDIVCPMADSPEMRVRVNRDDANHTWRTLLDYLRNFVPGS